MQPLRTAKTLFLCLYLAIFNAHAAPSLNALPKTPHQPVHIIPNAPALTSSAYLLLDSKSGKILVAKNADKTLPPASLTKLMTLYVVSHALKAGQIHLNDEVRISEKAWKTGGSRMFVKAGQRVSVLNLLKGIIVDSGNDACVALAEYVAGSEDSFASLMNLHAKRLGMNHSHFTDSTGLPNKAHYSTAHDLGMLTKALINEFPEYYPWYKQKWFTFNGIKQPNRNRLLWRNPLVDGLKTGHTKEAGYCLVASAKQDNTRFISVLLGGKTDATRASESQKLLTYGFRFFETHKLYSKNNTISDVVVWKSSLDTLPLGLKKDLFITIPKGQYKKLHVEMITPPYPVAPIAKYTTLGKLQVTLNKKILAETPLYALKDAPQAGRIGRMSDSVKLKWKKLWS